jgi:hypothetical protein
MRDEPESSKPKTPMERLAEFTRKLVRVPKEEIAEREREYKTEQRKSKRRG